jgi:hypothetical protein
MDATISFPALRAAFTADSHICAAGSLSHVPVKLGSPMLITAMSISGRVAIHCSAAHTSAMAGAAIVTMPAAGAAPEAVLLFATMLATRVP